VLELDLLCPRPAPLEVLCLGAHSDDLEIGCSGSLLSLLAGRPRARVTWVVFSAPGARADEARAGAEAVLGDAADTRVWLHEFRDGFFPYVGAELKEIFEKLKQAVEPDLVFTHTRHDLHQDHRLVNELTWNTWRDHAILEYEIPKYDGDLGAPNVFVPLSAEVCERKLALLMRCFSSQRSKHWFSEETFRSLLRLRGLECRAPSGYAEAFHGRKLRLGLAALP
jgi:LmbE family N-acetylglucosaminyl deacetylase